MLEIYKNLFVGSETDENSIRGKAGWFVVHACKEPYHRRALGYTGRAASKDHPEYLMAVREGCIILNLVDVDNVAYITPEIINAALNAIHQNIASLKVLVHCNQGASRSPTIAFLYLAKHTDLFHAQTHEQAMMGFRAIYPHYNPALGMSEYARLNWTAYRGTV